MAVVLTVLAVVTTGKGLSGALKKGSAGNGAAHAGAAEEAGTKAAVPPKASTHNNRLDTPKSAQGYTLRDKKNR